MLRFFSGLSFNACYIANNDYFPALLKGGIFSITNVTARLATILSPLMAEYLLNPAVTVVVAGALATVAGLWLR